MKTISLTLLLLFSAVLPLFADEPQCPCYPKATKWVVTECEAWNCAAASMVTANGDPFLFAIPTKSSKFKWIVVKRVASEFMAPNSDTDHAFVLETFRDLPSCSARFQEIADGNMPMMLTTSDGKWLLIYLKETEQSETPSRPRSADH